MDLKALTHQIVRLFRTLNLKQKITIVVTAIVIVLIVTFLVVYNTPQTKGDDGFRVLFSDLNPEDAAAIVKELEASKVEYKIPKEGVLEVRKEVVNKVRMDIAATGLPKDSDIGFELFDKQEFGATDFDQHVKYKRATEGELARTITNLVAVKRAKINLAIPKESVFVEKQKDPTASIFLELHPNMTLHRKQIFAIKNLVAAAIPKLTTTNVKIIDQDSNALGEDDAYTEDGEIAKMQMKFKRNYESQYDDKVINMLSPFIGGPEKVSVKTTIEFDFRQKNSTQKIYDPNSVPRSEQSLEEKKEGFRPKDIGGVPGAVSNIGPVQGLNDDNMKEKYSKSENTINYEISETVSEMKGEFGTIKRITVAVAIDGSYKENSDGSVEYIPRTEAELISITDLVKQAVGYNESRNDIISVKNFQFRALYDTQLTPFQKFMGDIAIYMGPWYSLTKYLILFLILFVFYKKVIMPFAERMLEMPVDEDNIEDIEIEFTDDELESDAQKLTDMRSRINKQLNTMAEDSEEAMRYAMLLEKLQKLVEEKPEDVAKVLTQLLGENFENAA